MAEGQRQEGPQDPGHWIDPSKNIPFVPEDFDYGARSR